MIVMQESTRQTIGLAVVTTSAVAAIGAQLDEIGRLVDLATEDVIDAQLELGIVLAEELPHATRSRVGAVVRANRELSERFNRMRARVTDARAALGRAELELQHATSNVHRELARYEQGGPLASRKAPA